MTNTLIEHTQSHTTNGSNNNSHANKHDKEQANTYSDCMLSSNNYEPDTQVQHILVKLALVCVLTLLLVTWWWSQECEENPGGKSVCFFKKEGCVVTGRREG